MRQKIRSLHDGFDGIAEIVGQGSESSDRLTLQLTVLFHAVGRFLVPRYCLANGDEGWVQGSQLGREPRTFRCLAPDATTIAYCCTCARAGIEESAPFGG